MYLNKINCQQQINFNQISIAKNDKNRDVQPTAKEINLNLQPVNYKPLKQTISFGNLLKPYDRAMLIIVDGCGIPNKDEANKETNPWRVANTPYFNELKENKNGFTLYKEIGAAEEYVGLDKKEPGNSEVGHGVIGTGRNFEQAMTRIDKAIENGSFDKNEAFKNAINHVKANNSTLHIMGALGYSHTHTKFEHYVALIKMAHDNGIKNLSMHIFTNGEGPTQTSALGYVEDLNKVLESYGYPHVSTIMGRNIAMDKSGKWNRIERAFDALTKDDKQLHIDEVTDGLKQLFEANVQGLEIPPIIRNGSERIQDNDAVIFANYRADRAIEITSVLTQDNSEADFTKEKKHPENLNFVCMTRYTTDFDLPIAFDNPVQEETLLEILSNKNKKCTTIAQKEKSAHVDFFLNGSRNMQLEGVKSIILPPNSDTTNPELNLPQISEQIINNIDTDNTALIVANFANTDILGHKGDFDLAVKGLEVVDEYVKKCTEEAIKNDIAVIITADHGNIEEPQHTKHTKNKVPCFIILPKHKTEIYKLNNVEISTEEKSALQDIAPTILDILGEEKSELMTGNSLIIEA